MFHKLTKIKIIVNEIWRVFKIFDSVDSVIITDEAPSVFFYYYFSGTLIKHIYTCINGGSKRKIRNSDGVDYIYQTYIYKKKCLYLLRCNSALSVLKCISLECLH